MPKPTAVLSLAGVRLDRASARPLHRQLYDALRQAILAGRLSPGLRLPSTRTLAQELDLSRNTVMSAFEQLLAEGYLQGKIGSGTYVSATLPDDLLQALNQPPPTKQQQQQQQTRRLSRRGALLATTTASAPQEVERPRAFHPGQPALDEFPFKLWSRLLARRWRKPPPELLGYGDPAGYRPLREAIASYLGAMRGVSCHAEQVIVTAGSQQALAVAARVLLDPDELVWMEDPGYLGARGALVAAGVRVTPVPVDSHGLDVAEGMRRSPEARLVYISPSHQYPTGVTMSLTRRLALLEWASSADAWVLEDDYDSEYRYASRPLAALQGLDNEGRVIYVGTFSKVLFPSLRLGYVVAPADLVDTFSRARKLADRHSPSVEQAALTDFMVEGHFARHIRRMRQLYAERRSLLVEALQTKLAGALEVGPAEAGMHLLGRLPPGIDDRQVSRRAAALGVNAPPLSGYAMEPPQRGGLVLGYAACDEQDIRDGVARLAQALATTACG